MFLVIYSLIGSCVLLAAIGTVLRRGGGFGGVLAISAIATIVFMCAMSFALMLQALLTVIVAAVCWVAKARPRTAFFGAIGAMAASYAIVLTTILPEARDTIALRAAYPLESLSPRLAYEPRQAIRPDAAPLALAADVEMRLANFEDMRDWSPRAQSLMFLHDRTRDEFILARGFGPVRMGGVSRGYIELPEPAPIPLPTSDPRYSPEVPPAGPLASAPVEVGKRELFLLHDRGIGDLLKVDRMGYVRDREHVAGFQSHAFSELPALQTENNCKGSRPLPWQLVRLELVGLLSHPTPIAYVSRNLPRMDELRAAPTRPLDAFEQASLDKLLADEDVVFHQEPGRIQMLGALRAAKDCLECHTVRRGELLGALSYELIPLGSARPPVVPERPEPQARLRATFGVGSVAMN